MLRPFQCEHCGKTYKTKGHLKDHVLVQHIKVRNYKCQICKNEFGRYSTLLAHSRTHKKNAINSEPTVSSEELKNELEHSINEATTSPGSNLTLVKPDCVNEEEKNFWSAQNEDYFSFALGENEYRLLDCKNIFDTNFEQPQFIQYSRRNSNNYIMENATFYNDDIMF